MAILEFIGKVQDSWRSCHAKAVDGLIVIADGKYAHSSLGQELDQSNISFIEILVLIDDEQI